MDKRPLPPGMTEENMPPLKRRGRVDTLPIEDPATLEIATRTLEQIKELPED